MRCQCNSLQRKSENKPPLDSLFYKFFMLHTCLEVDSGGEVIKTSIKTIKLSSLPQTILHCAANESLEGNKLIITSANFLLCLRIYLPCCLMDHFSLEIGGTYIRNKTVLLKSKKVCIQHFFHQQSMSLSYQRPSLPQR